MTCTPEKIQMRTLRFNVSIEMLTRILFFFEMQSSLFVHIGHIRNSIDLYIIRFLH